MGPSHEVDEAEDTFISMRNGISDMGSKEVVCFVL